MDGLAENTQPKTSLVKSWITTLVADFATDLALGLLAGAITIVETGDWTQATIHAIALASLRTALQHLRTKVEQQIVN